MLIPKLFFFSGICQVEFKYNWTILRFSNSLIEIMWKHNPVGMPIPGPAHFYSTGVGNRRRPTFNWITSTFCQRERERQTQPGRQKIIASMPQKVRILGSLKCLRISITTLKKNGWIIVSACEFVGKLTFVSSGGIEGGSGGDTSLLLRENSIPCFHTLKYYHQPQWRPRIVHSTFVSAFSEICKLTKLTILFGLINIFIILKSKSHSVNMSMNITGLQKCKSISSTTRAKPLQSKSIWRRTFFVRLLTNTHTEVQFDSFWENITPLLANKSWL